MGPRRESQEKENRAPVGYLCVIAFTSSPSRSSQGSRSITRGGHRVRSCESCPVCTPICKVVPPPSPFFGFSSARVNSYAMPELFPIPFSHCLTRDGISNARPLRRFRFVLFEMVCPPTHVEPRAAWAYGSMWHQWYACMDTTP
jgi:hypothetical protein